MRKIIIALLAGFLAIACSESNPIEHNNTEIDIEKIADCVVAVSEEIDPLFTESETIEELATHLDEIKNMEGVADAWVTNTALFVETEGGFHLSWLYMPDADKEKTEIEKITKFLSDDSIYTRNISWNEHKHMKDLKKVCILNQQANDESRAFLNKQYKFLGEEFKRNGFEITSKDGEEINTFFLRDSLTNYDVIFFITHGVYDKKNNLHWIASGERVHDEWECVVEMGRRGVKGYQIGKIGNIKYICLSEDFFKYSMHGKFRNSLIFNTACQSLMGTNTLAKTFIGCGASVYWGYDETNYVGKMIGCQLYLHMLQGNNIQEAFNLVPQKDHNAQLKIILKDIDATNICIVHPQIVTLDATEIKGTSVTMNAKISGWNNAEFGFCYSKDNENPTVKNGIKYNRIDSSNEESSKLNFHSVDLDGLEPSTTYYYRAYMRINEQYIYGDVKSFTTAAEKVTGAAEAIDLGLSVKWASHNVGATKPEEFGNHYAWGETEVKEKYTMFNYKYCNWSTGDMVNIGTEISGTKYDVATVKWGGNWRMPTANEMLELTNNCEWTDSICNGVRGKKVTGVNGNSIFLPAAGAGAPGAEQGFTPNEVGVYWTGTLDTSYSEDLVGLVVSHLHFEYGYFDDIIIGTREDGLSVRPVCE